MAHLQLRLKDDAGEGSKRSRRNEAERDIALGRDAVELGRMRARAEHVEIAAKRQVFEDEPQRQAGGQRVDRGRGHEADIAGYGKKCRRQISEHLLPAGVPGIDAVEHRAGAERCDEGVDLDPRDQEAVHQPDQCAA